MAKRSEGYERPPDVNCHAVTYVQNFAERVEIAYCLVREHLQVAAERWKRAYYLCVRPAEFVPGSHVRNFHPRRHKGRNPKLEKMYTGPFILEERCGPLNNILRNTANSRPFIVHVDKLRPCGDGGSIEQEGVLRDEPSDVSTDRQRPRRQIRLPARGNAPSGIAMATDNNKY